LHYERYYDGHHPLKFATSKFQETFGQLFAAFSDNWCQVVVDASVERLKVQGFRFGADQDYVGDQDAWAIWQANQLDTDSGLAHLEAGKSGLAYLIVDAGDPPRITVESPCEVFVATAPGDRRQRVAALKRWVDYDGKMHATVYLPAGSYRFVSRDAVRVGQGEAPTWLPDSPEYVPNPFGRTIPVIPMANKPRMMRTGTSDLATAIALQDAIDKLSTDMMVAAEYAAFRQRWATGIEIPIDPLTGNKMEGGRFLSHVGRIWAVEDQNAKFGEFDVTDLRNYVAGIEMFIQHLAAQTRTPPHYLTAGLGQWPSGDSLKASESGLVAKVVEKQAHFGEAWEEGMRLAFVALGDARGSQDDAEVIWKDAEYRSTGELVDSLVKMRTLGVPLQAIWERYGASPQEIARWRTMQEREVQLLGPRAGPVQYGGAVAGDVLTPGANA
jgi:hypothetical protein